MSILKLPQSLQPKNRYYGQFGGQFVAESLAAPLKELETAFYQFREDPNFVEQFNDLLKNYAGRSTPLTEVKRFSQAIKGPRIFLKREDLLHTGAHKINHALGHALLAKFMGKKRILCETGAGQHGVATATVAAHFDLDCVVYMGAEDMRRQAPNVERMRLLGAEVIAVNEGSKTLKDAVSEALRDWSASFSNTYFCLGSALGPHPYPEMVSTFQSVIGREARAQCLEQVGRLPDVAIACVGGGSNAIGLFSGFIDDPDVRLIGVEAGGKGTDLGEHAARFLQAVDGVLHGCYSYVLQDENGQIAATHSISAGLDYPSIGPQHAMLRDQQRVSYELVQDDDVIRAFELLAKTEGIIPAFESSHALAYMQQHAQEFSSEDVVIINCSGRGDKDLPEYFQLKKAQS